MKTWFFTETGLGLLSGPQEFASAAVNGRAVALGYFDGVHLGHLEILRAMKRRSLELGIPALVHTFSSLPKSKIAADSNGLLITTLEERCAAFSAEGMDEVAVFPFSDAVASLSAQDFLEFHIRKFLRARVVIAGADYRFGKNREGDMKYLQQWGNKYGVEVICVAPIKMDGRIISSSWVRDCITNGNVSLAEKLLTRPVSYEGVVVEGKKLGRKLGFPTANIAVPEQKVIPHFGVYASIASFDGHAYQAITNVGLRPTIREAGAAPNIETLLFDCSASLYQKNLRVSLLEYIRPEKQFDSTEILREQISRDVDAARLFHITREQ